MGHQPLDLCSFGAEGGGLQTTPWQRTPCLRGQPGASSHYWKFEAHTSYKRHWLSREELDELSSAALSDQILEPDIGFTWGGSPKKEEEERPPSLSRSSSREVGIRVPFFLLSILVGEPSPKKGERRALLGT